MKIAIGCDEAAYNLKVEIIQFLKEKNIEVEINGKVMVSLLHFYII